MKALKFVLLLASFATPALAYQDGTYRCKNLRNLPENLYKIQTISVAGVEFPYVEATRFSLKNPVDPHSPISESHIKGFAAVATGTDILETMLIGALQLEFTSAGIAGCERSN